MSEPSQQPSQQARRATAALSEEGLLRDCRAIPKAREIIERETGVGEAAFLLRGFLDCLPQNRDWLDPDIERQARAYLAKRLSNQP